MIPHEKTWDCRGCYCGTPFPNNHSSECKRKQMDWEWDQAEKASARKLGIYKEG